MEKYELNEKNWIEKSNVLNEMRTPLNLTEMRLLLVYQSKINARNPNSTKVTFSLESFQQIMNINHIDISGLKANMKKISQRSVEIPYKNGFQFVPLYQRCGLYQKETGKWYVDIECNREMLPYMFEMKKNYFKYRLWNAVNLTSLNQIRMYEILKQYEKIGTRTVSVDDLKAMLGIDSNQYVQYRDFKRYVLDVCKKAIETHTDIKYTYDTIKGAKGKVLSIIFNITKNPKFKDDLKIKEFIKPEDLEDIQDIPIDVEPVENTVENRILQPEPQQYPDLITKVYKNCQKSYSMEQVQNLLNMVEMISDNPSAYIVNLYYTIRAYNTKINNMYNYTLSVIQAKLSKKSEEKPSKKKKRETSYDIHEFMEFTRLNTINAISQKSQEEEKEVNPPQQEEINLEEEIDEEFEEILFNCECPF